MGGLTYPFQHFSMAMTELVLKHGEEVSDDVETLCQQTNTLVHLQVAPHGLVDWLEVRLNPEQLGGVENTAVEVDVDTENEELADLHIDLLSRQVDLARRRDLGWDVLARVNRRGYELLKQRCLQQGEVVSYNPPPVTRERTSLVRRPSVMRRLTLTLCANACDIASLVM